MSYQRGVFALAVVCATASSGDAEHASHSGNSSVSDCVQYWQTETSEEPGADLGLQNQCGFAVNCQMSWRVTCRAEKKKRPRQRLSFPLDHGQERIVSVSASLCGQRDWFIRDVQWQCTGK